MEKFGVYRTEDGTGEHKQIYTETEIDRSDEDAIIVKVTETTTTYTFESDDVTEDTEVIADTTPEDEDDSQEA